MSDWVDDVIEAFQADPRGCAEAFIKLNKMAPDLAERFRENVELSILFGEVKPKQGE